MTLSLLFTSAISAVNFNESDKSKTRIDFEDESLITEQESKNLKTCTQNLASIGEALRTYEKEHGDFPEWLSELHPQYLTGESHLICPADEEQGVPILPYDTDPNLPVSYNYDCTPEYYQQWLKEERHVYNGANPIVQCPHHANPYSDSTLLSNLYLNLSFSNTIYLSEGDWRKDPIGMYGNLKAAIAGYEKALHRVPEDPNFFNLYSELIRLYVKAEQEKDAENLIESFKSVMKPHGEDIMRFRDYWTLVDMLKVVEKHEEAFQLLQHLEKTEQKNPFIRSIYREIAMIHEEKGNIELARAYFLKADSKLEMIGKPAPDFSLIDIDGNSISLKDYRGKVVLLYFWATWCGPCTGNMPIVKKVYDANRDFGFDVIGINRDTEEADMSEYLNVCSLPWRQIFDGKEGPLKKLYRVSGMPSKWLIDKDGNIISYEFRSTELHKLVRNIVNVNGLE
ncbi:MAG: redoxin domain-containing protein [Candidatus Poribacteria bacterium]|nr:redoxin domain-containing protein [Candidatus Poribacteria bacterium]